MTVRDLLSISSSNLLRMKLRTFLTAAGVLIAIAAFVAMLSFGAGNQAFVEAEFNKLGLFTTMQVYAERPSGEPDSIPPPQLDAAALDRLAAIPGVNLVYPYEAFSVQVTLGDSSIRSKAQSIPASAMKTRLFSQLIAGAPFTDDSSHEAIISEEMAREAGFSFPESAIGKPIVVSVQVSTIDSGLAHIFRHDGVSLFDRMKHVDVDSLFYHSYRTRILRRETNEVVRRFLNGFIGAQQSVRETLTVGGVRGLVRSGRLKIEPVLIPIATAARFKRSGLGGSPTEMFTALRSGTLFADPDDPSGRTYSQVTLDFDPHVFHKTIQDSVEALGYRTFSFAAQFENIQRMFIYFDLGLGLIGLIALITASLGIVNTMVMSINERRREIGVLKALGAHESNIRALFLFESGVIGVMGTYGGIAFGWLITRVASAVARGFMAKNDMPEIELFALPIWLIGISLLVGIGVSVLAGLYPAARASRIDPVEALRSE